VCVQYGVYVCVCVGVCVHECGACGVCRVCVECVCVQVWCASTLVGTKKRSFNPDWFKTYNWLEYSVERDAAFCFPCRHFSIRSGRAEDTFTKEGFRDWKHATGKEGILQGHASCLTHIQAVSSWREYKLNEERGTSVASRLDSARNDRSA